MASDHGSPPSSLNAKFTREVQNALAQDSSQSVKAAFFDVWQRLKPEYETMHQALNQYLTHQLEESSIRATLHSRVKKDDSISKSIDRREEHWGKTYDSPKQILDGIHDLVGFRIVVDYPSGLDQSYQLIKKHFSVERINTFSTDRDVGVLWKPRFGAYEGKNFQVRMSPDEHNVGLSIYYEVLFEIQVTSIAESLYNRLAHPLHYKKSSGTLSRQDEMIIDISHGLSLCYWITIACMEERLEGQSAMASQTSPLPHTVRKIAGHDPEDELDDLDDLVNITPDMPVIPGDRSLGCSKTGPSTLKRTAPSDDTVSIELLLKSLIDLPQENRSDADVWNGIRDRLGLDDDTYSRFLKSFTYDRMNDRKNTIQQRHHDTFEWVFADNEDAIYGDNSYTEIEVPSLASWLEEDDHSLYWVSGKPGSGKSFFMKFIEKDERTTAKLQRWRPQCRIISHYLWKPGSHDQRSLKGVVCSLLHQILQDEKAIALRHLREAPALSHKYHASDWDIEDAKKLLFNVLGRSTRPYLILIDGLDELSKPHYGMKVVFQFLDGLARMEKVKVCVSSRPEPIFITRFRSQPSLRMQDLTKNDIRKYTVDKLRELDLEFDNERFREAGSEIVNRAEGVFIWVYIVLRQIKLGVDEFCETWDDILDHIFKLPSDLMGIYRDMLSKFDDNDEKYVKRAARYFQYMRERPGFEPPNIAMLSLVADENVLDSFTRPEDTTCVDKWAKLCRDTEKTLFPISAGLLEIRDFSYQTPTPQDEITMYPWRAKKVTFIHRTATDFLEGEEGKAIFGKYAIGPEDMLMMCIKMNIAHYSVGNQAVDLLYALFIFNNTGIELVKGFSRNSHDALSLLHACSTNKSRQLVYPPCSVSHENTFLFNISYLCCYGYLEKFLTSSGNYEASAYVLAGACTQPSDMCQDLKLSERYRFIRNILNRHYTSLKNSTEYSSTQMEVIKVIMWAWRCFLIHQLDLNFNLHKYHFPQGVISKELLGEIIVLFLKIRAIAEVPGSRYLLRMEQGKQFHFVEDIQHNRFDAGDRHPKPRLSQFYNRIIYVEVNDKWMIQQLFDGLYLPQQFKKLLKENAFLRILVAHPANPSGAASFFHITTNEGGQEATVDILRELNREPMSPYKESTEIKSRYLGSFTHPKPALEKIGYEFPDINKTHICLHESIQVSRRESKSKGHLKR
ncbi:unnamed protein product [Fusarium graminearum]|nr:unnamed protein product [Fusarium graminearum]